MFEWILRKEDEISKEALNKNNEKSSEYIDVALSIFESYKINPFSIDNGNNNLFMYFMWKSVFNHNYRERFGNALSKFYNEFINKDDSSLSILENLLSNSNSNVYFLSDIILFIKAKERNPNLKGFFSSGSKTKLKNVLELYNTMDPIKNSKEKNDLRKALVWMYRNVVMKDQYGFNATEEVKKLFKTTGIELCAYIEDQNISEVKKRLKENEFDFFGVCETLKELVLSDKEISKEMEKILNVDCIFDMDVVISYKEINLGEKSEKLVDPFGYSLLDYAIKYNNLDLLDRVLASSQKTQHTILLLLRSPNDKNFLNKVIEVIKYNLDSKDFINIIYFIKNNKDPDQLLKIISNVAEYKENAIKFILRIDCDSTFRDKLCEHFKIDVNIDNFKINEDFVWSSENNVGLKKWLMTRGNEKFKSQYLQYLKIYKKFAMSQPIYGQEYPVHFSIANADKVVDLQNVNALDHVKRTLLMVAAYKANDLLIDKLLASEDIDVKAKDLSGNNILDYIKEGYSKPRNKYDDLMAFLKIAEKDLEIFKEKESMDKIPEQYRFIFEFLSKPNFDNDLEFNESVKKIKHFFDRNYEYYSSRDYYDDNDRFYLKFIEILKKNKYFKMAKEKGLSSLNDYFLKLDESSPYSISSLRNNKLSRITSNSLQEKDSFKRTNLMFCIDQGDFNLFTVLLNEENYNLENTDALGNNVLHYWARAYPALIVNRDSSIEYCESIIWKLLKLEGADKFLEMLHQPNSKGVKPYTMLLNAASVKVNNFSSKRKYPRIENFLEELNQEVGKLKKSSSIFSEVCEDSKVKKTIQENAASFIKICDQKTIDNDWKKYNKILARVPTRGFLDGQSPVEQHVRGRLSGANRKFINELKKHINQLGKPQDELAKRKEQLLKLLKAIIEKDEFTHPRQLLQQWSTIAKEQMLIGQDEEPLEVLRKHRPGLFGISWSKLFKVDTTSYKIVDRYTLLSELPLEKWEEPVQAPQVGAQPGGDIPVYPQIQHRYNGQGVPVVQQEGCSHGSAYTPAYPSELGQSEGEGVAWDAEAPNYSSSGALSTMNGAGGGVAPSAPPLYWESDDQPGAPTTQEGQQSAELTH